MTTDERTIRTACHTHPGRPAVAECESCGRALCLSCAVPVRGQAIGPECLSAVLGGDAVPEPLPGPAPRPRGPALALAAFGGVLAATVLPWTRFGQGSGAFGAWDLPFRWSLLVVGAALVGLGIAAAAWLRRRTLGPAGRRVLVALAAAAAAATALHVLNPPPFARPWVGPWVALAGSAAAMAVCLKALRPLPRASAHQALLD